MKLTDHSGLSRRKFLQSAVVGGAVVAAPSILTPAHAASRRIVVRDPGGDFSNAFKVAFHEPFSKATGVEVIGVSSANEPISQMKMMVDSKSYAWDVAGGITMASAVQLMKTGDYIEKHGLDDDPVIQQIPTKYRNEYAIGIEVYTAVMGYRTDKFPDKQPKVWADFFNVKDFPGRRGMRKSPVETLEIALFADGVTRENMYPLDVDRAFKKLTELKPHIAAWWTAGAQATQMIASGEVDMIATWSSRTDGALQQGAPVATEYDNNIWGADVWAILKGTPNLEICKEYIKFCSTAERQAALSPFIVNGPVNPNAYKFIDPERAKSLTTYPPYEKVAMELNADYWTQNRDALSERFNAWLLS